MPRRLRNSPLLWIVALALAGSAGLGVLIVAGLYDVSAVAQHTQPVHSLLEVTMRQSVRMRARNVPEPPLGDAAQLMRGAACYRQSCESCHGGPGVAPAVYARALQPVPRPLADAIRDWSTREIYWITRNGIKMSGMPAWRGHLDEAQTWAVVAFVARLATLSPAEYRAFAGGRCNAGAQHAASQSSSAALAGAPDAQEGAPVDPAQARQLLRQYGCHACHAIPGLSGPARLLGPPLAGLGRRATIAGRLPNDAATLRAWIQHPQRLDPLSAMPELEVSDADARVIAAWLATLQ